MSIRSEKRQNCSSYIPKIRHPPNTAAAGGKGKLLFREAEGRRGGREEDRELRCPSIHRDLAFLFTFPALPMPA